MKSYTVERATWYRGNGILSSRLLDSLGTRCCLGHIAEQCNIEDTYLLDKTSPWKVDDTEKGKFPEELLNEQGWNSDLTVQAMTINDDTEIDDETREENLINLFAEKGIELTFV